MDTNGVDYIESIKCTEISLFPYESRTMNTKGRPLSLKDAVSEDQNKSSRPRPHFYSNFT